MQVVRCTAPQKILDAMHRPCHFSTFFFKDPMHALRTKYSVFDTVLVLDLPDT